MQIHPTRASVDLALTGIGALAVGLIAQEPAMVAWTGALLVGLALARAVTMVSVARVRAAGFEMLWRGDERMRRIGRGETIELSAEIRNRDSLAARYVHLRAVSSPDLEVELEPTSGEVPAAGRLAIQVRVHAPRVGQHGIHGLSLEVQGSPGLFEVPLTFANPYGVEVLPQTYSALLRSARGGRSRMNAQEGRAGVFAGDGSELRELRDHQPGDPWRRIAWRASARRGKLLVREHEREERDVVWLLLDASVELWSGKPGVAPLDHAIDEVAAVLGRHLARGDAVGLGILASRCLTWIPPSRGATHLMRSLNALATDTGCWDADRSDLDEADVAARVIEHMRPLDPGGSARLRPGEPDKVLRRAERVRARAPFTGLLPNAGSGRERRLRRYLSAFGMHAPPRMEPERTKTDLTLTHTLKRLLYERPRPSIVYLWSPAPSFERMPQLEKALSELPLRRLDVRWVCMRTEQSIPREGSNLAEPVADALGIRMRIARERGEQALRRWGLRIEPLRFHAAKRGPLARPTDAAASEAGTPLDGAKNA
ncbi:MAG TPA: DUF58 domain-containing protein [Polyangiaceae bacterium]|nr:DUF58 domain-containing protein [Polyangiaceae bacterium]